MKKFLNILKIAGCSSVQVICAVISVIGLLLQWGSEALCKAVTGKNVEDSLF